jgi:glucosamine 6-phosphate synthetase-like amidotransferase/phosphosugar isomerase protein
MQAALAASLADEAVPSGVRLLSAGADAGTVRYGAAKFVELTRIPAWSGDLEEFAHSQYWATPATDLIVVVAAEPALAKLAAEACEALAELGMRCIAVDTEAAPVITAARRVTLPSLPTTVAPLATAIPLQALAHGLARASGLDPDTRLHLKDDAARFRVSRMLTRRSLLGTGQ